jgi:aminoglycoside N3'-acetyltransferase
MYDSGSRNTEAPALTDRSNADPPVRPTASIRQVADQLRELGVAEGGVLLVHTSFRAVGPIEGGPAGLIEALALAMGRDGTLVMPSWPEGDEPFDPASTEPARDLGVVASTFWRLPGVLRSDHPNAFAAWGPRAEFILQDPLPLPPHIPQSPVGRVGEMDGQVLLLGVNHDANTTIHLAELIAGVPYRVPKECVVMADGRVERIAYFENDHCCARFAFADDWLGAVGLQRVGRVGQTTARLARSRDVVNTVVDRLAADPLIFLHAPSAACSECDAARASVSTIPHP